MDQQAIEQLFDPDALSAIPGIFGRLVHRAGKWARGALPAAARESCPPVAAEHLRAAASQML